MGDVNSKKQQAHHLRAIFLAGKSLKAKPTEKSVPPFARVKSSLLWPEGGHFFEPGVVTRGKTPNAQRTLSMVDPLAAGKTMGICCHKQLCTDSFLSAF